MYGSLPFGTVPFAFQGFVSFSPEPPESAGLQRWNGSAYVPVVPKRWNGSAYVDIPLKRWNGVAFVDV